jgi:hypothetical protein
MASYQFLKSTAGHSGLYLDPRTKLACLTTISVFVLGEAGGKLFLYVSPLLTAIPLFLMLTQKKIRATFIYTGLYAVSFAARIYLVPVLTGLPNYLLLAVSSFCTRFIPGLMMAYYTVSTTTVSEFTAAMQRMHIPQTLIIPLSVVFRFIPTILEEAAAIRDAMQMRDIRLGGKKAGKMLEYQIIPAVMCTVRIGEELSAAALSRGLGGSVKRTNLCTIGFRVQDIALLCICASVCLWEIAKATGLGTFFL